MYHTRQNLIDHRDRFRAVNSLAFCLPHYKLAEDGLQIPKKYLFIQEGSTEEVEVVRDAPGCFRILKSIAEAMWSIGRMYRFSNLPRSDVNMDL